MDRRATNRTDCLAKGVAYGGQQTEYVTKRRLGRWNVRMSIQDPRESRLWANLLGQLSHRLVADEILAVEAGVKIVDLQSAGIERYVFRLATEFTARRNHLTEHPGKGRKPVYD